MNFSIDKIKMENVLKAQEPNFLSTLTMLSRKLREDRKIRARFLEYTLRALLLSVVDSGFYNEKKEKLCSFIACYFDIDRELFKPEVINIIKEIDRKEKETENYHNSKLKEYIECYFDNIKN
jgi:hypothetical protein